MTNSDDHTKRQGPGRRMDDRLKCPWCDIKTEHANEKWDEHEKETHENRELVCTKIGRIERIAEAAVSKKTLYAILLFSCGVVGWVYTDHFGLSKQVSYNTAIIAETKSDITEIKKDMREFLVNQKEIMYYFNLKPVEKK